MAPLQELAESGNTRGRLFLLPVYSMPARLIVINCVDPAVISSGSMTRPGTFRDVLREGFAASTTHPSRIPPVLVGSAGGDALLGRFPSSPARLGVHMHPLIANLKASSSSPASRRTCYPHALSRDDGADARATEIGSAGLLPGPGPISPQSWAASTRHRVCGRKRHEGGTSRRRCATRALRVMAGSDVALGRDGPPA